MAKPEPTGTHQFGRLLRAFRTEKGLSLTELADRTYSHRGSIGNIENGKRLPDQRFAELADTELNAEGQLIATWHRDSAEREHQKNQRQLLESALADSEEIVQIGEEGLTSIDQVGARTADLAVRYLGSPAAVILEEAATLRREVTMRLRRADIRPSELPDAFHTIGRLSGVLAYAALDLGYPDAALAHTEAAWHCSELSGDAPLKAWTRGTQSLIFRFKGDNSTALSTAMDGRNYVHSGEGLSRLLAAEAQCRAVIGDSESTNSLLDRGMKQLENARDGLGSPGIFGFTEEKQHYYTGSSLIWLDGGKDAERAAEASAAAIAMWSTGSPERRSLSDEALAHVYLATAHLQLGAPEQAIDAIRPILSLPPERRFAWIAKRLSRLITMLSAAPYADALIASSITAELREFIASTR